MRRGEDVFFLTLVDFLLQVSFFGLVMFVVWQSLEEDVTKKAKEQGKALEKMFAAAGVSDLTRLTDFLTRLVPYRELLEKGIGPRQAGEAVKVTQEAGGTDEVWKYKRLVGEQETTIKELQGKIAELEGYGKKSCLPYRSVNGRLVPPVIARVVVRDDSITIQEGSPEFDKLLQTHGLAMDGVRALGLSAFRSTFARVVNREPECRYFVNVQTETKYLDPMRALWSAFRTQ